MDARERFRKALRREQPDRVPIHDSLWAETMRRWQKQGLPTEIPSEDYFGYEMISLSVDRSPLFEVETLHEDNEYIVETTFYSGVSKTFAPMPARGRSYNGTSRPEPTGSASNTDTCPTLCRTMSGWIG